MERLTGRRREHRQPEDEMQTHTEQQKEGKI